MGTMEKVWRCATILPMANNLRLDVVAEGVETVQQVALLKKLPLQYGQGYYFSRPLSVEGDCVLIARDLKCKRASKPSSFQQMSAKENMTESAGRPHAKT